MSRRWRYAFFCLLSLSAIHEAAAADPELWKLVAQSDLIAKGVLVAPLEQLAAIRQSGKDDYVSFPIRVTACLKGNCGETFSLRHYTEDRSYSPSLQSLQDADGKESLFFLVVVDANNYFAGYTPKALRVATANEVQAVQSEVAAQGATLSAFSKKYSSSRDPHYFEIKTLVDDFTHGSREQDAFRKLEKLGDAAVPSMIALMDDRRDLAIKQISLVNKSPDAFEGIRHYGPQKVVDAIDALLNQITGEYFGRIHNGGSEQERRAAVNGWRIFLDHREREHPAPAK